MPWPVYFLLAPINLLELLIIRPASLTIRLFANMVSGHLMVATCLAFAQFWMVDAVNKLQGIPVGALWFAGGFAMTCFERSSPSCKPTSSRFFPPCTST